MNIQEENFINIVSAYINKDTILNIENVDIEKQYELSVLHNLSTILYIKLEQTKHFEGGEIYEKLMQSFYASVKYSVIQEATALQLFDILNRNKIKHIVFKGFVLKDLYPNKEARTMGDIDIVIEPKNRNKVHQILLNSGYNFDPTNSKQEVWNYKKNNVLFEIHTKIVHNNLTSKCDYVKYFSDNFNHVNKVNEYTYEFDLKYHFIYLITHLAKHFKFSGFGIRMLLDISVFLKHFNKKLDWKVIEEQLDILGLSEFTSYILKICNKWFKTPFPYNFNIAISEESIESMENYIISGGTFGYNNRNIDSLRINKDNNNFASRLYYMTGLIFPSYEFITKRYVWAKDTPKYLLPLMWVKLWYYRVFVIKENSFKRVIKGLRINKDAEEHYRLMKMLGLE